MLRIESQFLHRQRLAYFLIFTLGVFFTFYVYLLNQTIVNAVGVEAGEKKLSLLASKLGDLEGHYLSLKNSVTLEVARAHGFSEVNTQNFVTIKSLRNRLTLRNEI